MSSNNPVPKIYRAVIDDVIKNVKESFLNEGVDEQVLNELKQLWESKLLQSRAIDFMPSDVNVNVKYYPHTDQGNSSQTTATQVQQQQQRQQQVQQHQKAQQQPVHLAASTATRVIQNPAGSQIVYVSQHPTLGNVGLMSGAASQAAMALQNAPRGQPRPMMQPQARGILPQNLIVGQPGQVIQLPASQGQPQIFQHFGQRILYAQPAPVRPQPPSTESKQPSTRIVQVDGANDPIVDENAESPLEGSSSTGPSDNKQKSKRHKRRKPEIIIQFDGANGSDSEEDDDEEDYDNIPVSGIGGAGGDLDEEIGEEDEDPLNSEDDVSDDEDPTDLFDTDNVVVCQYDKIARTRNRWKFHLKDGIMNLRLKDFVFHKANGDAEW